MRTIREQIMDCLSKGAMSAIEISKELGIWEREIYENNANNYITIGPRIGDFTYPS